MHERVRDVALAGVSRAAVVALALVLVGLVVDALLLAAPTARSLAEGSVFELLLGVFVGGPTAALERWLSLRTRRLSPPADERLDAPTLGLLTVPLAWAGAAAAFLQSLYAEAALRSGSTDVGLEQLVKNGRWLLDPLNVGGLCGAVALTFGAAAVGRRWAPDDLRQQALLALGGPVASAVLLGLVAGLRLEPALVTFVMSGLVAVLLPPLCLGADRLEERLGAWLGPGTPGGPSG